MSHGPTKIGPHERLMLTAFGGLAEFERTLMRARTGEGRERAKARSVHMGRAPLPSPATSARKRAKRLRRRPILRGISMSRRRFRGYSHD
jgi:DNA invertase Pin-like site-specific DNA recombinase